MTPAPAEGAAVSAESASEACAPRPLTSVARTFVRNPSPSSPAANETGKPAPIPAKTSTAPTDIPYVPVGALVYVRLVASIDRPISGVRRRAPEPDSSWKRDARTSLFVTTALPASVTLASGTAEAVPGFGRNRTATVTGVRIGIP